MGLFLLLLVCTVLLCSTLNISKNQTHQTQLCQPSVLPHSASEQEDSRRRRARTRLSVCLQSWPPEVQQPEMLNEIFKASVLSAVRWSRQTAGLHDVMPKPHTAFLIGSQRAGWSRGLGHCGLLRRYNALRLHIRVTSCLLHLTINHYWLLDFPYKAFSINHQAPGV